MSDFTLSDLAEIIERRAQSDDEKSYTRLLVQKGSAKCAQKLGEEAVEAAIAAVQGDKEELVGEAADVLYHLLVLLEVSDVSLNKVMQELARRTSQTGLEEKASR
ncbi:MAG: phosphoribosyl-ATP diphosphatase [Stappiaceae bacterium]